MLDFQTGYGYPGRCSILNILNTVHQEEKSVNFLIDMKIETDDTMFIKLSVIVQKTQHHKCKIYNKYFKTVQKPQYF